jgi:hypothetical protein
VFATPPDRTGFTALAQVRAALARTIRTAPTRLVLPLGVGNHVDHVEALVAATDLAHARGWLDRLCFYEDLYALSRTMRRAHPVTRHRTWRAADRGSLARVLARNAGARRGPDCTSYLVAPLRDAAWTATRAPIGAAHEATKLDAIACYRSQTRAFGGFAGLARALRAYHAWWRGAEPLWSAQHDAIEAH